MKGEWFAKLDQAYGDMQKAKEAIEGYYHTTERMTALDVLSAIEDAMTELAKLVEVEERKYYNRNQ